MGPLKMIRCVQVQILFRPHRPETGRGRLFPPAREHLGYFRISVIRLMRPMNHQCFYTMIMLMFGDLLSPGQWPCNGLLVHRLVLHDPSRFNGARFATPAVQSARV